MGMVDEVAMEEDGAKVNTPQPKARRSAKSKSRAKDQEIAQPVKRRCVSTACIACRKRKSKCDGNTPSCAACSSVYHTPCIYDPNSDHRRKGVYKQDIDNLRNRNTTLQTLVQAILNYDEEDVLDLVRQIRSAEDLEAVAESILKRDNKLGPAVEDPLEPHVADAASLDEVPQFETELSGTMGQLKLDGAVKYVGGTCNLIFLPDGSDFEESHSEDEYATAMDPISDDIITCWTSVTKNKELIRHLLTMYFTWHYAYFTTLSKNLFYRDLSQGRPTQYCSALLVNAMLALGCHFSAWPAAREDPDDTATAGDHFFREAKRLILDNDEHEKAKLCTVQALAIMSVREAGCGREGSGWVYSGMSFRMASDLGLNVDSAGLGSSTLSQEDIDARRITFWGCFLFDKCWSNYLGRQPQLSGSNITVPKFDVFPDEDAEIWSPYTDAGVSQDNSQPSRTRAVALQISRLCEISSDLLSTFYHPAPSSKHMGKQEELRRLSQLHTRLEAWRRSLPKEMEPRDGQLPQVLLMHMFFQLLFIHLYRPFLKYTKSTSPLPAHVSPRKLCTQSASVISKLFRIYKRTYGFRQICNVAVYIAHSACTIHLLNLPDKGAKRDIIHGLKTLEEVAESWLCARRTLRILDLSAQKWNITLPDEAGVILERSRGKFGSWRSWDQMNSPSSSEGSPGRHGNPRRSVSSTHYSTPEPSTLSTQIPFPATMLTNHASTFAENNHLSQSPPQQPATQPLPLQPLQQFEGIDSVALKQEPNSPGFNFEMQPTLDMVNRFPRSPFIMSESVPTTFEPIRSSAFASTENLVEASQNWWLRDQSALALGLENWPETWGQTNDISGASNAAAFSPTMQAAAVSNGAYNGGLSGQIQPGVNLDLSVPLTTCDYTNGYVLAPASQQNTTNGDQPYLQQDGNDLDDTDAMFYSVLG